MTTSPRFRTASLLAECPKTATGRPAAAKQLKEDMKALARSSTFYYQSTLPETQRVSKLDLDCLGGTQWLPVRFSVVIFIAVICFVPDPKYNTSLSFPPSCSR